MSGDIDVSKNGITKEEFAAATKGQVLVDIYERRWKILRNLSVGAPFPTLVVKCSGYPSEELMYHPEFGIVDEEVGTIEELNNPKARIEAA